MKDKIAIFVPSMGGGGAERQMLNLAVDFVNRGHSVDLILAKAEGSFLSKIPDNVNVVDLNVSRVAFSFWKLRNYLRKEKPSALLTALSHINVIAILAKLFSGVNNTRLVVSERSTPSIAMKHAKSLRARSMHFFMKAFYPKADSIVAVSEGVKSDLAKVINVDANQIRVIYNPVISNSIFDLSREGIDHPWINDNQLSVLIGVGRFTEAKGFDVLINAFKKVTEIKGTQVRLIVLGRGELEGQLKSLVKRLKIEALVDFPGFVSNPYKYIKGSSVFVLSSNWEGLPGVLVESLALGVPVIATDCPSGPKEILQNGKYGRLVPVGNPELMAAAIIAQLNEKQFKVNADLSSFEATTVVDQYLKELRIV